MKIVLYGAPAIALYPPLERTLNGDSNSHHDINTVSYGAPNSEIVSAFDNARAVIAVRYDNTLPHSDTLALVQVPGVGYDEIDLQSIPPQTSVCNVSGHGPAVAEYALLSMLQCRHRFLEAVDSFKRGSWERSSRLGAAPHGELAGSVVGLLGYGLIGRSIAQRLGAMDVTTLVCNRTVPESTEAHPAVKRFYPLSELGSMVPEVDFLVCVIALNENTQGLVNSNVLRAMKSDAVLVNVARGPVVEEQALYEVLVNRKIGGAVLDVWYNYPADTEDADAAPSKFDFATLPNTYITPHISGWTDGTVNRRIAAIAANLKRLDRGEQLSNIVQDRSMF